MSNFTIINNCRCCNSEVTKLLDLNNQPLANSYHAEGEIIDEFPLALNICEKCFHTQLSVVVNPELMFKNYLYVSGTTNTLKEYFDFFAKFTIERYKAHYNKSPQSVLDIACNDGTQLDFFKKYNVDTYGIDPAENLLSLSNYKHNIICDYFPSSKIQRKYNIIVAQNVFAHTHNIFDFLKQCYNILEDEGTLYIQTSQSNMILNNEFDTIYHEHLSFFNSSSMKIIVDRCKLNLNNVFKFDIHGSSYIFEISKNKYDTNIESVIVQEYERGLYNIETYNLFAANAKKVTTDLKEVISKYKKEGYTIIGYGAAAKGMTLLNFGKIQMDYIIDDNSLKHGLLTPGMNISIGDISILKEKEFTKILFVPLAWNFYTEIYKKIKQQRNCAQDVFVKYFPSIKILS